MNNQITEMSVTSLEQEKKDYYDKNNSDFFFVCVTVVVVLFGGWLANKVQDLPLKLFSFLIVIIFSFLIAGRTVYLLTPKRIRDIEEEISKRGKKS